MWRNVKATGPAFLLGIAITAVYQRYVPANFLAGFFDKSHRGFGILTAAALGVPAYVCGGGTIPLIMEWLDNGMSLGAAAAFMVTGPATKITNLSAVKTILGIRRFIAYLSLSSLLPALSDILRMPSDRCVKVVIARTSNHQQRKGSKKMKRIAVLLLSVALTSEVFAESPRDETASLSAKQRSIVTIAALTASGELDVLKDALNAGLDAGLTINETGEILVQMYAYSGFPRSLNGLATFRAVLQERQTKGIKDNQGKASDPLPSNVDKYALGRRTSIGSRAVSRARPSPKGWVMISPWTFF